MDILYTLTLALFLLVAGLGMANVTLPQVVRVIGGVCGIIAALIILFGLT